MHSGTRHTAVVPDAIPHPPQNERPAWKWAACFLTSQEGYREAAQILSAHTKALARKLGTTTHVVTVRRGRQREEQAMNMMRAFESAVANRERLRGVTADEIIREARARGESPMDDLYYGGHLNKSDLEAAVHLHRLSQASTSDLMDELKARVLRDEAAAQRRQGERDD